MVRFLSVGEGEALALKEFWSFLGLSNNGLSVERVRNCCFGDGCLDGDWWGLTEGLGWVSIGIIEYRIFYY